MQDIDTTKQSSQYDENRESYFKRVAYQGGARGRLYKAIKDGLIIPKDCCQLCNSPGEPLKEIIAHHADYSKALDVIWLCKSCHQFHHKNNGKVKQFTPNGELIKDFISKIEAALEVAKKLTD